MKRAEPARLRLTSSQVESNAPVVSHSLQLSRRRDGGASRIHWTKTPVLRSVIMTLLSRARLYHATAACIAVSIVWAMSSCTSQSTTAGQSSRTASHSGGGGASVARASASASKSAAAQTAEGARLYEGFGNYTRTITTSSADAQRWFNQGIQLLYGFNHDEAIRSFRAAAAEDPKAAMPWWGIAYASGLHINNPQMSEKQSKQAWEATQEALARLDHASPVEKSLILAVSKRYAWPIPEDRKPLDMAYADAMQGVWKAYPNDPDVGALYAESLMNLQPWDLWNHDGTPKGRTPEIVATLERVIELRIDHPGANHFYIHA